ncbi:hypothetical protein ABZV52_34035, partial [Streptomyces sp. NPDC004735]
GPIQAITVTLCGLPAIPTRLRTVGDLDHLVPDPAAALHALLVHGLVRPAGAHLPERFTALQLVRLLHLRDRTPAAARAC